MKKLEKKFKKIKQKKNLKKNLKKNQAKSRKMNGGYLSLKVLSSAVSFEFKNPEKYLKKDLESRLNLSRIHAEDIKIKNRIVERTKKKIPWNCF